MDDKFEDFIRDNRDKFDIRDPDPGLWSIIEKKQVLLKRRSRLRLIMQRAALIACIFAASYAVNEWVHRHRDNKNQTLSETSGKDSSIPGLQQAESYYVGVVTQKMDELKPIMANCPLLKEELNQDMSELDSVYSDLKNDLKDNMANQEVIEAIIENYRLKISILESLLNEIKPQEDECLTKKDRYAL